MGNDYYVTNEHMVHEDGHTSAAGEKRERIGFV